MWKSRFKNLSESALQVFPLLLGRGYRPVNWETSAALSDVLSLSVSGLAKFYRLFHKYSTRLILHDLLVHQPQCTLPDLTHYASEEKVAEVLDQLQGLGLISRWHPGEIVTHFPESLRMGWLLEWYIAAVLEMEFGTPAIFNVGLRGTRAGGDYDVLASWLGKLLYIEAKSAPPRGIHNPEIGAFLERVLEVKADLVVFLNDTHLRVKDKIVLMFEEELIKLKGVGSLKQMPVERVREQIFHIDHYVYITNTRRDIRSNFKIIFHDYLSHQMVSKKWFS